MTRWFMPRPAGSDYADLIAESPVTGFLPKAELSAAAIRRILGTS
jgi:hypothetical protein